MAGYDTNLASEFYVLSMLHRRGLDATITLGNKKSVDIIVAQRSGLAVTIDVKGLAGSTSFPMDNAKRFNKAHFFVFVCFYNKIRHPGILPEVYVVPAPFVKQFIYTAPKGRIVLPLSRLRGGKGAKYRDGWKLLEKKVR